MTLDALHNIVDGRRRGQRHEHAGTGRLVAFRRIRGGLDALAFRPRLEAVGEPVVDAIGARIEGRMRRVDGDAARRTVQQVALQRVVQPQGFEPAEDGWMVGLSAQS